MGKEAEQVIQRDIFYHRLLVGANDIALTDYDTKTSYSYRELDRRAKCLANYLQAELKMTAGDRLGICARNCPVHFDAFLPVIRPVCY